VAAPAGSGKTVLLRSWITEAGLAGRAAWVAAGLKLLVMRAPPGLRFVLAARHDMRLGLHQSRLKGGLAQIRAGDLKFTLADL